ncbi:MAG: hybrid sensor histidine kinase/response regulator [Gammaproteobacteria bacterium]|nr:hybrid sensor histidine kinase/response regulator [Gammaproteobacteria bacterium]
MTANFSILIVDDKPINIDVLRLYIEIKNYQIFAVTSGEQALTLLKKVKIDLILLDIMMPDLDGYQTCLKIKLTTGLSNIPIIFVTAKNSPEELSYGFSIGAADYITKPVHKDILLARIENQLSHLRQRELEYQLKESNKMAELGSMVATITHEVASPMGNVLLALDLMANQTVAFEQVFKQNKLTKSDFVDYFAKLNQTLALCLSNGRRANQLMNSFKQVAVDQCSDRILKFNLSEYVDDILITIRPRFFKHHHNVKVDIDQNVMINNYSGALSQVIINIINNAIFHGFSEVESGLISITGKQQEDQIMMTFEDNGAGMSELALEQAFDKFFTTKADDGGSGLGLSICRDLVEKKLAGLITIESHLGQGTKVTLLFPKQLD